MMCNRKENCTILFSCVVKYSCEILFLYLIGKEVKEESVFVV